jgi:hypothetical protein
VSGPTWLSRILAAVMIAVALYHGARLVVPRMRSRSGQHDVDLTHLAMGVAMALILLAALSSTWSVSWGLAFAGATVWFTWQSMRVFVFDGVRAVGAHLPHALGCAAMIYMLLVLAGGGTGAGASAGASTGTGASAMPDMVMAAASVPGAGGPSGAALPWSILAMPLLVVMGGVAALNVAQLRHTAASRHSGAPVLAGGCRLAMTGTMIYMLVMVL